MTPTATLLTSKAAVAEAIAIAARAAGISRGRTEPPKDARALVQRVVALGHLTVAEHVVLSFEIVCSRAISHELVRHRLTSITQESTRYVRDHAETIAPSGIDTSHALDAYRAALEGGASVEAARYLLPHALATRLVITANLREWWHIIHLRSDRRAAPEIQELAVQIDRQVQEATGLCAL